MSAEECKGYACPPSTTVDLPECEHGWELGNNTAVCATEQPASQPLALTGPDPLSLGLGAVIGLALGLAGVGLMRRTYRRNLRADRDREREHAKAKAAETTKRLEAAGFVLIDGTWTRAPLR